MRTYQLLIPVLLVSLLIMGCAQQSPQTPPAPSNPTPQPAINNTPPPMTGNATPPAVNNSSNPMNGSNTNGSVSVPSTNNTKMNQSNGTSVPPANTNQSMNQTQPPPQPPPQPKAATYSIDANDGGFYMDGASISSISVPKGATATITFNVLTTMVYHGGLDFRGCGQSVGGTPPGQSVQFQFAADSSCGITSYWPSTGVAKRTLEISVQ